MSEPETLHFLDRLDRLERDNRRLKRFGALSITVVAALVGMAQVTRRNKVVSAERFVLLDARGAERGALEVAPGPQLHLEGDGGSSITISMEPRGEASLRMGTYDGPAIELNVKPPTSTAIRLTGGTAEGWVGFKTELRRTAVVELGSSAGHAGVGVSLSADEEPDASGALVISGLGGGLIRKMCGEIARSADRKCS
jgi:hypothetical protein